MLSLSEGHKRVAQLHGAGHWKKSRLGLRKALHTKSRQPPVRSALEINLAYDRRTATQFWSAARRMKWFLITQDYRNMTYLGSRCFWITNQNKDSPI